jgi:hypothetical protein
MRVATMSNELEAYRERVRHQIMRRTGEPILNGSVDHAAILCQEIFLAGENEILILSNRLDEACFGREGVRNAAKILLGDPDKRMRVLVEWDLWDPNQNFDWSEHPFVESLLHFWSPDTDVPRFDLRTVHRDYLRRYRFNFMVLDSFGYRFQDDRDYPAAVAAFFPEDRPTDATDTVIRLRGIFDTLYETATPLDMGRYQRQAANRRAINAAASRLSH